MLTHKFTKRPRLLALLATAAFGGMLAASSASAQDYGRDNDDGYYRSGANEEVQVIAPRPYAERGPDGAPIQDVAISRAVRFDDLDLRTYEGARELRERVEFTARTLCQRLDTLYPISASNSPPCYRTALDQAMYQVHAAIRDARGEASTY